MCRQSKIVLLIVILMLYACAHKSSDMEKYISPSELIDQLGSDKFLIVDTRTNWEYGKGHIPGAVHIPLWKAPFTSFSDFDCSDKTIVLYCEHGPRAHISHLFIDDDCVNVKLLEGHMQAWKKASYPLE